MIGGGCAEAHLLQALLRQRRAALSERGGVSGGQAAGLRPRGGAAGLLRRLARLLRVMSRRRHPVAYTRPLFGSTQAFSVG